MTLQFPDCIGRRHEAAAVTRNELPTHAGHGVAIAVLLSGLARKRAPGPAMATVEIAAVSAISICRAQDAPLRRS